MYAIQLEGFSNVCDVFNPEEVNYNDFVLHVILLLHCTHEIIIKEDWFSEDDEISLSPSQEFIMFQESVKEWCTFLGHLH